MSNSWFRLYYEFAFDPKIQSMSETMQRRFIMLLCLRCSNDLETLHETEIAFALHISAEELTQTKVLFVQKNFIDETWNILHWDERQFVSDSSTARVAKHREKKKKEEKPLCNVSVTPPDTDSDTDSDIYNSSYEELLSQPSVTTTSNFEKFWKIYPRREKKKQAREVWKRKKLDPQVDLIIADVEMRKLRHQPWLQGFIPHATSYLNGERWHDEVQSERQSQAPPHALRDDELNAQIARESEKFLKMIGDENASN